MQITTNILLENKHHNKPIVTDVFYNQNNIKKPIVIFCHGYKSYKDWGAWNLAAKSFAKSNFFFVKFNFSHNGGTAKNPIDFPDLEAFGQNNFTIELNDLEAIIDWVTTNDDFKNEVDLNNITLIGHSRGGGIVSIKASENNKISKVITWNGVADYAARFPKEEKLTEWKNSGVMYMLNGRTKQEMPHYYQFYQDFKENEDRLTIKNAIQKLNKPLLIINGNADTVVMPIEGEMMQQWNPKNKWRVIDEMNHTLGSKHPWQEAELPTHLKNVVQLSIDFIKGV